METMEEMDLLIKSELEKCGIPILLGAFSGGIQGRTRKHNALNVRKCQSF